MNELLFYSLLTALTYYFLVYAKPIRPNPKLTSQSTQTDFTKSPSRSDTSLTDPLTETSPETTQQLEVLLKDQQQKERTIQGLNQSYEKLETKKNQQIKDLQKQISTLKTESQQTKQQLSQLT